MKVKVAEYVVNFLVAHGVTDCFTVVGGGAMHLNDAFGHTEGMHCIYNHHEQACAMAAEGYTRLENKIAAVCVTSGPGGTNAITGVAGGWLDSIPMFIVSDQVRYDTTARYAERFTEGLSLRAVGNQEFDIVKSVSCMCKYAAMVEDASQIRYMMEKAWHLAITGRPGPSWLDIPVDIQGTIIETDELEGYDPSEDAALLPPGVSEETVDQVLQEIRRARRPVIYAGYGIRLSGGFEVFRRVVDRLGVPVVTYWDSVDLIEDAHPLYCGRGGDMGDRPGNFAVQNADLVLAIGTRISLRQVGYNWKTWAREARVIMVDIDRAEFKKHTIHVDMPVWADAGDFLEVMERRLPESKEPVSGEEWWRQQCLTWKQKYPVTLERHWKENGNTANVFAFVRYVSETLPERSLTAVSNGACCVVGHQDWCVKKGSRFIINNAIASMGYGLPAAIGLCIAGKGQDVICLEGDGSLMMNLQELQTVVTNKLPIKLFLINNEGYHSIRQTQNNLFKEHSKVGIGPESHDLSFPDYEKIAVAFGIPYYSAHSNEEMKEAVGKTLRESGYVMCEIFTDTEQVWEPKSSARRLPDGRLVSPPLEDLAPFLDREELRANLFITPIEE